MVNSSAQYSVCVCVCDYFFCSTVEVDFDKITTSTYLPGFPGVVPIAPRETTIRRTHEASKASPYSLAAQQLPLAPCHCITVHKSQGVTTDVVVVVMGHLHTVRGLSYVACSRCKTSEGLIFMPSSAQRRLVQQDLNCSPSEARKFAGIRAEYARLGGRPFHMGARMICALEDAHFDPLEQFENCLQFTDINTEPDMQNIFKAMDDALQKFRVKNGN